MKQMYSMKFITGEDLELYTVTKIKGTVRPEKLRWNLTALQEAFTKFVIGRFDELEVEGFSTWRKIYRNASDRISLH